MFELSEGATKFSPMSLIAGKEEFVIKTIKLLLKLQWNNLFRTRVESDFKISRIALGLILFLNTSTTLWQKKLLKNRQFETTKTFQTRIRTFVQNSSYYLILKLSICKGKTAIVLLKFTNERSKHLFPRTARKYFPLNQQFTKTLQACLT